MRSSIIIISYDGISSLYCGVGTVVRDMILSLNKLNNGSFDLYLLTSAMNKKCLGYSSRILKESKKICKENNGKLIYLKSFRKRTNQYGNVKTWEKNSFEAYNLISKITNRYSKSLIILNDAPFLGVAKVAEERNLKNCTFIWIPHGTGYLHEEDKKSKFLRIKWERKNSHSRKNFYVGYISEFMKKHLKSKYFIRKNLVNIKNGILLSKNNNLLSSKSLLSKKILKDKKIILSYGRSEPYKNLHAVINASKFLSRDYQTLVIASNCTSNHPLNRFYKRLSSDSCKIIPHHIHKEIILDFIRRNEVLVVIPSLKEPFGIIPCEARYHAKESGSIILASKFGGLREQISDGKDGFVIDSLSPSKLAKQIESIFNLSAKERKSISLNGFKTVKENYNYEKSIKELLSRFL